MRLKKNCSLPENTLSNGRGFPRSSEASNAAFAALEILKSEHEVDLGKVITL
jgi:hypothetical protein